MAKKYAFIRWEDIMSIAYVGVAWRDWLCPICGREDTIILEPKMIETTPHNPLCENCGVTVETLPIDWRDIVVDRGEALEN